jgi:sugar lactone lactonase YvrE
MRFVQGALRLGIGLALAARAAAQPAANDLCAGAIPLQCGSIVTGSTQEATPEAAPFCNTFDTAPGVWYSVVGVGAPMVATTCNAATAYDTKLSVYTGGCGALACIRGNDDDLACGFGPLRSTVAWFGAEGTTYFLLVHGFGSAAGDFELSLACGPAAPAQPGVCYASTGGADGGRLLRLDLATGAGTLVGPTGLGGVADLAIDSNGAIYGTERASGDLYRIDAATGQAFFVVQTGIGFLDAIAFDENDVLYGIGADPPGFNLRIIDPQAGGSMVVGPTGDLFTGMAFDPSTGQLYASTGGLQPAHPDAVARIDRATGVATFIGTTGLGGATPDLFFVGEQLYGVKGGGGTPDNDLIAIDRSTGAGTVVGPIGFSAVSGLACYTPPRPVLIGINDVDQSEGVDELVRFPDLSTGAGELIGSLDGSFVDAEAIAVLPAASDAASALRPSERIFVVDDDRLVELDPGSGLGHLVGPIGFPDIDGISFHPGTGVLYGITYGTNELITIDIATGAGTLVAEDVIVGHRPSDLTFHPDGRAFVVTGGTPRIYEIDIATGAKLAKWVLTGGTSLESLLWSPDGMTLYSAADRGATKDLVTIELGPVGSESGTVSFLDAQPSGFRDVEGLAWLSPQASIFLMSKRATNPTDVRGPAPTFSRLHQNMPNPFNPSTRIEFEIALRDLVDVGVYDVAGRRIATLFRGRLDPGLHAVTWNGRGADGRGAAAGIYRCVLRTSTLRQSRSMALVK